MSSRMNFKSSLRIPTIFPAQLLDIEDKACPKKSMIFSISSFLLQFFSYFKIVDTTSATSSFCKIRERDPRQPQDFFLRDDYWLMDTMLSISNLVRFFLTCCEWSMKSGYHFFRRVEMISNSSSSASHYFCFLLVSIPSIALSKTGLMTGP